MRKKVAEKTVPLPRRPCSPVSTSVMAEEKNGKERISQKAQLAAMEYNG